MIRLLNRFLLHSLLLTGFLTLFACDRDTVKPALITMQVADTYRDCVGLYPRKCMQVKEGEAANWTLFYDPIEGFTFEEGYEYVLLVKRDSVKNPPADGSSLRYTLVRELSRVKK